MSELAMSVEETIQPSFTVTANAVQPTIVAAPAALTSQASSPPPESYANNVRPETYAATLESDGLGPGAESLERWTQSQKKANESDATLPEARAEGSGVVTGVELEPVLEAEAEEALREKDGEDTSFGPDIAEPDMAPTTESATRESEPEVPSPVNTPSPPPKQPESPATEKSTRQGRSARTPLPKPRPTDGFQPINRYSPHRNGNFAVPSPSKNRRGFSRKPKTMTTVEQDSFAEDNVKKNQVKPQEKLANMLGNYTSATSNGSALPQGAEGDEEDDQHEGGMVPGWEESVMRPAETIPAETSHVIKLGSLAASADVEDQAIATTEASHRLHAASNPTTPDRLRSPSPSQSPLPRRRGFNALMDEEGSSLGMPSEARFSQDHDFESQHSTRSTGPVATQTLPSHPAYLSSPPPSPARGGGGDARSHSTRETDTAHTASSHSHARSLTTSNKGDGTTQEATQLVTEDELVFRRPTSPPSAPSRRALPTAAARRAGRDVSSQPADRSRMMPPQGVGPHTIAGPQAVQAGRESRNGPPALEDTYVDPQTQRLDTDEPEGPSRSSPPPDVEMRSPSPVPNETAQGGTPSPEVPLQEAANTTDRISPPPTARVDLPMTATYVDPTLTSLPLPVPKRPTPAKYGKHRAHPAPTPPPIATPSPTANQLTPPPTAGPSRSPPEVAEPRAAPPKATKSGRISKRKRRESSASLTSSSSSSEDVDAYDESYRPAIVKPVGKVKGKGRAANPSLKRVKGGRSRSTSHASSAAGPSNSKEPADVSTPLTALSEDTGPVEKPWIIAWWSPRWYIGRVRGIIEGKYDVDYEDGTHSAVAVDKVRRGMLVVGDRVKDDNQKNEEFIVLEAWDGDERGVKVKGRRIPLARISIRQSVIRDDFQDRLVTPKELGFDFDPPPPPQPQRPPMGSTSKSISSSSDVFAGKIFLVTSASASNVPHRIHQRDASTLVTRNGGKFVEKWYDLFDLPSSGFGSTLASTSAPFLIQETSQASLTPKALVSLAKGIPCLSMAYIDDAIADPTVDWRSYLVESGFSERLQQHCSQVVNGTWGSEGWNAGVAQAERRPFLGRRFLFLEPRDKKEIKRLILVCLHAMGAVTVDCVQNLSSAKEANGYDFVLVEDRDKKRDLPDWLRNLERACNIPWLKQCLIMGASLKPGLIKDK